MEPDRLPLSSGPAPAAAATPAALEPVFAEALLLNLDASLRVHARAHFFNWTQGLLQSLIRHEVLICALRGAEPRSPRVDSFAAAGPGGARYGELFAREASAAPALLQEWRERGAFPLACEARPEGALCGGELARALQAAGAPALLAHGARDADGEVGAFFVFCCRPGSVGERERYLAQLALPALHAAWVRAQLEPAAGPRAPARGPVLTPRELEILRWIAIGKSNFEVGAILSISPLTVKNHVQKILRKLNAVNRTQAVGKALENRMLGA
jgi:transcriptional regulator EpsA